MELPDTLLEWKTYSEGSASPFWESLRPFFAEHGWKLWTDEGGYARPHNHPRIRSPDQFHHWIPYMGPGESGMPLERTIHFPARSNENQDVVIRLLAKGGEGTEHVKILQALAELDTEQQHVLPLLDLLTKDDMTFAIFPFVCSNDDVSWFSNVEEVLQHCEQVFRSFAFIHEHRIAHRDFGSGEILLNFGGGFTQPINGAPQNPDAPFRYVKWRHLFPLRYYLNDFELAVQFDADSDPSTRTRLVQGLPTAAWGHTSQDYLKELAPESLKEEPYCPFKADVYQVAFCSAEKIQDVPALLQLLGEMLHPVPAERPSFAEALIRVIAIRDSLSPEVLAQSVEEDHCSPWASHILPENRIDPILLWQRNVAEAKERREKQKAGEGT